MDIKAGSDRQVQALADEIPSRLQREIRAFEQKEVQLHKEYQLNMGALQDAYRKLKENELSLTSGIKEKFQQLELVHNETKFKTESLAKSVQLLEQQKYEQVNTSVVSEPTPGISEQSLLSLKEQVILDRQKGDAQYDDLLRQSQQQ